MGNFDKAIIACKNALKNNSKDESAWTNLGSAYYNKKLYDKAIDALRKALEIIPHLEFAQKLLKLAKKAKNEELKT